MACDYCKSLDLQKLLARETILHHGTFKDLEACAFAGFCQLCDWIHTILKDNLLRDNFHFIDYYAAEIYCQAELELACHEAHESHAHGFSKIVFEIRDRNDSFHKRLFVTVGLFVPRGNPVCGT